MEVEHRWRTVIQYYVNDYRHVTSCTCVQNASSCNLLPKSNTLSARVENTNSQCEWRANAGHDYRRVANSRVTNVAFSRKRTNEEQRKCTVRRSPRLYAPPSEDAKTRYVLRRTTVKRVSVAQQRASHRVVRDRESTINREVEKIKK